MDEEFEDVMCTGNPGPLDPLPLSGGAICGEFLLTDLTPKHFTFVNNETAKAFLTVGFDPPSVEVDPDLDWNQAARMFWNAVYRMVGKPALFPD
jgi:hypothetical protein